MTPYRVIVRFVIEDNGEPFHEMRGMLRIPDEGDILYLNDAKYKVEGIVTRLSELFIPDPSGDEWRFQNEIYVVTVTEI